MFPLTIYCMVAQDSNSYFMIVTRLKFLIIMTMTGLKVSTTVYIPWQDLRSQLYGNGRTLGLNYRKVAQNMYTYTDPLIHSCARHSDKDSKFNSSAQNKEVFVQACNLLILFPLEFGNLKGVNFAAVKQNTGTACEQSGLGQCKFFFQVNKPLQRLQYCSVPMSVVLLAWLPAGTLSMPMSISREVKAIQFQKSLN